MAEEGLRLPEGRERGRPAVQPGRDLRREVGGRAGRAGFDQDQGLHQAGVGRGQQHRRVAAEGLAQEDHGGHVQCLDQDCGVLDMGLAGRGRRCAGAGAVSAGVVRHHAVAVGGQLRGEGVPLALVAGQAVQEEERGRGLGRGVVRPVGDAGAVGGGEGPACHAGHRPSRSTDVMRVTGPSRSRRSCGSKRPPLVVGLAGIRVDGHPPCDKGWPSCVWCEEPTTSGSGPLGRTGGRSRRGVGPGCG